VGKIRLVVGDIEYQFGWDDILIPKVEKLESEKMNLFFDAVKHAMWQINQQGFNINFPKFKVSRFYEIGETRSDEFLKLRMSTETTLPWNRFSNTAYRLFTSSLSISRGLRHTLR
jgi:hypothetical protein